MNIEFPNAHFLLKTYTASTIFILQDFFYWKEKKKKVKARKVKEIK